MNVEIKNFEVEYQNEVKNLILQGLKDHWGFIDYIKNPDLNNIGKTYRDDIFITVWSDSTLVGTGALIFVEKNVYRIVRISVKREYRRSGIGKKVIEYLLKKARKLNSKKIIVETTETWKNIIKFYQSCGFSITEYRDGDCYFELFL